MFSSTSNYATERLETVGREVISNPLMRHAAERRSSERVVVSLEAEWEGMSGMAGARSSIERLAHLVDEHVRRKWFLQEVHALVQNAVVDDCVVRVAGHV